MTLENSVARFIASAVTVGFSWGTTVRNLTMRLEDFVERSGSDFVTKLRNIVNVPLSAASPGAKAKVKELRKDAGRVRHSHKFATQRAFDQSMNKHHTLLVLL